MRFRQKSFGKNMKPTNEQCLEICKFCIAYLYDKYSTDKGLFRSTVSQTDVRSLQSQVAQSPQNKFREDLDPNVVAEVLQTTFKDMSSPLLNDVYHDIVETEIGESDMEQVKDNIQKWIVKMPENKFYLVSSLFRLLSKLAGLDENDSNLLQLAHCISPTICRPTTSAYMSIRHMEDLRKIRPVIAFIIENYDEIFSINLRPVKSNLMAISCDLENGMSQMMSMSLESTSGNNSLTFAKSLSAQSMVKPNLLVTIPSASSLNIHADSPDSGDDPNKMQVVPQQAYSETEWNVLESIIFARINGFIDLSEKEVTIARQHAENNSYYMNKVQEILSHPSRAVTTATPDYPVNNLMASITAASSPGMRPGTPADTPITAQSQGLPALMVPANSSVQIKREADSKYIHKSHRRGMVVECKSLRTQIFEYEQDFTKKNGRAPKAYERGPMQVVYSKYRELKKDIRNSAAVDIQRIFRGSVARYKYHHFWSFRRKPDHKHEVAPHAGKSLSSHNVLTQSSGHTSSQQSLQHNTVGSKSAGSLPSSSAATGTNSKSDQLNRYRDLLNTKRDLKRKLKKFDEDFIEQYNRAPKKADKEVIRPMYQQYHEIKTSLDQLKITIETAFGPLPDDLLDDRPTTPAPSSSKGASSDSETDFGSSSSSGVQVKYGIKDKYLSSDDENEAPKGGISSQLKLNLHVNVGNGSTTAAATPAAQQPATGTVHHHQVNYQNANNPPNMNPAPTSVINVQSTLEALQLEKRNLHAYLKVYERDFNKLHGRPVTKHEDIQPVAHEYQRYKELKGIIKEMKQKESKS